MSSYREDYKKEKKSKFMQGILIGAITGAAISLLDKHTRESVVLSSKQYLNDVKSFVKNPNEVLSQVREASLKIRSTIENISDDVAFISERVEEMKEIPPQLAHVVMETKEALSADNQQNEKSSLEQNKTSSLNSIH